MTDTTLSKIGMYLDCMKLLSVNGWYLKAIRVPRIVSDILHVLNTYNDSKSYLISFGHPFNVKIDLSIKNRNGTFCVAIVELRLIYPKLACSLFSILQFRYCILFFIMLTVTFTLSFKVIPMYNIIKINIIIVLNDWLYRVFF